MNIVTLQPRVAAPAPASSSPTARSAAAPASPALPAWVASVTPPATPAAPDGERGLFKCAVLLNLGMIAAGASVAAVCALVDPLYRSWLELPVIALGAMGAWACWRTARRVLDGPHAYPGATTDRDGADPQVVPFWTSPFAR